MMKRVGLTGGIGSGKTTVAGIFEVLGIPVYYADEAAKRLMQEDETVRRDIIKHFGEESYVDNILNRAYLAKVFSNEEKTALINSIIHPATLADAARWMAAQNAPYAIKEAALIFEADAQNALDLVIGVHAPAELRIARTMTRSNISRDSVLARMARQMPEEEKMNRCDIVINNDGQELLIPQVLAIHRKLLAES